MYSYRYIACFFVSLSHHRCGHQMKYRGSLLMEPLSEKVGIIHPESKADHKSQASFCSLSSYSSLPSLSDFDSSNDSSGAVTKDGKDNMKYTNVLFLIWLLTFLLILLLIPPMTNTGRWGKHMNKHGCSQGLPLISVLGSRE